MASRTQSPHKYDRVKMEIQDRIRSQTYRPGESLPTHRELARLFKVSDITIRRAIHELVNEGMLTSRRGRGVSVVSPESSQPHGQSPAVVSLLTMQARSSFFDLPFYSDIYKGLRVGLESESMAISIWPIDDEKQINAVEEHIRASSCATVILGRFPGDLPSCLTRNGSPIVFIDNPAEGLSYDSISIDNTNGAYAAVMHLLDNGHRRIAFINDALDTEVSRDRLLGYTRALHKYGLSVDEGLIGRTYVDSASSRAAVVELYRSAKPTALFAFDDTVARGALSHARDAGLRVPEDLAVIGFGGREPTPGEATDVTTMAVDAKAMGQHAAKRLLSRLGDSEQPVVRLLMQVTLVEGPTT